MWVCCPRFLDPGGYVHAGTSAVGGASRWLGRARGRCARWFLISLPIGIPDGATVTGIAITAAGSSSEFGPCIGEDDLALFSDGFEMGDTSAWAPPQP